MWTTFLRLEKSPLCSRLQGISAMSEMSFRYSSSHKETLITIKIHQVSREIYILEGEYFKARLQLTLKDFARLFW